MSRVFQRGWTRRTQRFIGRLALSRYPWRQATRNVPGRSSANRIPLLAKLLDQFRRVGLMDAWPFLSRSRRVRSNHALEPTATARRLRAGLGFALASVAFRLARSVAVAHLWRSASGALGMNQNPKAHPNRAGDPDGSELAPAATTDASGRNIDRRAGLGQALRVVGWLPNHRVERTATSRLVFDAVGTRNPN